MSCLIISFFYFTQHLMHCRQYSITVLRLLQRRLCHGPSASKGSSYHTHTNIHELSNPWEVCIVICSELWQSMACNPNCTCPPAPLHKTNLLNVLKIKGDHIWVQWRWQVVLLPISASNIISEGTIWIVKVGAKRKKKKQINSQIIGIQYTSVW